MKSWNLLRSQEQGAQIPLLMFSDPSMPTELAEQGLGVCVTPLPGGQPVLAAALCHFRAPALLGLGVSIHPFCPRAEQAVLIQGFVLVPEQTPSGQ